jgi:hypothetical protein
MSRPQSPLTAALLADLDQKIDARCTALGKSRNALLEENAIDKRNLENILSKASSGHGDVYLGTIGEICRKLDIVLEHDGFILGPVIRP